MAKKDKVGGYWQLLLQNPLAVGCLAMLAATILIVAASSKPLKNSELWSQVTEKLAEAIFVSGAFAAVFDSFSKGSLIDESVRKALGQNKCMSLGLSDLKEASSKIDYGDHLINSKRLIVSSRFSDRFLTTHKDDLIVRLNQGRSITFVVMQEGAISALMPGYDQKRRSPSDFFRAILRDRPECRRQLELLAHPNPFCYNFVLVDTGLWVKFYWNSSKDESPPAIFLETGSSMYQRFHSDIDTLMHQAVAEAF